MIHTETYELEGGKITFGTFDTVIGTVTASLDVVTDASCIGIRAENGDISTFHNIDKETARELGQALLDWADET